MSQAIYGTLHNPQLNSAGKMQHFLDTEGLSRQQILNIFSIADSFYDKNQQIRKVPLLRNKAIANVFFETSTRTRSTFEVAAKKLSADVLNLDINSSATSKGESLLDTIKNLQAMQMDAFVMRHQQSGAAHFLAAHIAPHVSIINAGDGRHAHPSQALLDMYTISRHKQDFSNLSVAIIGDIAHSRVARSQIHALLILGCKDIRLIGPCTLLPKALCKSSAYVRQFNNLRQGIENADVAIALRLQKERMEAALIPSEAEFFAHYGLDEAKLKHAKDDVIIMHPGPTNRGVEIDPALADGKRSVIMEQVTCGIAIRMAIMSICIGNRQQAAKL